MPPPRPRLVIALAALAGLLLALAWPRSVAAAHAAARWRWPVRGEVVGVFRYSPRTPFAARRRRGIDIAAPRGAAVRAACAGRVTYAGPVPGGRGVGVTVRCGDLVATHLGLGRLAVRRGARVVAGRRLGALGRTGRLRLGARRRDDRFAYVDPLDLLAPEPPPSAPHAAPLPLGRAPRGPVAPRVPVPRPAPLPLGPASHAPRVPAVPPRARLSLARAPRAPVAPPASLAGPRSEPLPAARPHPAIPGVAWGGLVLLAAGVPLGGLVRRSHRRRARRTAAAAAVAEGR